MNKTCTICKEEKDISHFDRCGYSSSGDIRHKGRCKPCCSIIFKETHGSLRNIETKECIDSIEGEEWKQVVGYEGLYSVSNLGRVISHIRKTYPYKDIVLSPAKSRGRFGFRLSKGKAIKRILASRLVATAFIPNPHNHPVVNHLDGDKTNDKVSNLEWCTYKRNSQHAYEIGLNVPKTGEDCFASTLTNKQALEIFNSNISNCIIAEKYNVSEGIISNIKTGRNWGHLTNKVYVKKVKRLSESLKIKILSTTGSNRKVAKMFNIGHTAVGKLRRKNKILNNG